MYEENEIKVLKINATDIINKLNVLWAQKVFDDERVISSYDYVDWTKTLQSKWQHLKITEEGTTKISIDGRSESWLITSIKNKISRKREMESLLDVLWLQKVAEVRARRVSFERNWVDIDIDFFPMIQPFVEIDADSSEAIEWCCSQLWLDVKEWFIGSTIEAHKQLWVSYFEVYKK